VGHPRTSKYQWVGVLGLSGRPVLQLFLLEARQRDERDERGALRDDGDGGEVCGDDERGALRGDGGGDDDGEQSDERSGGVPRRSRSRR
jgi:hypothetical protein